MLSLQIGASENTMKNSTKWNSRGVKKIQGYSPSTSEPHSPQSDPALKLMMRNEQAEHEQPQSTILRILRDPGKGRTKRDRERKEKRQEKEGRGKREKIEEERRTERMTRKTTNEWRTCQEMRSMLPQCHGQLTVHTPPHHVNASRTNVTTSANARFHPP